jgi:hypothetical protein
MQYVNVQIPAYWSGYHYAREYWADGIQNNPDWSFTQTDDDRPAYDGLDSRTIDVIALTEDLSNGTIRILDKCCIASGCAGGPVANPEVYEFMTTGMRIGKIPYPSYGYMATTRQAWAPNLTITVDQALACVSGSYRLTYWIEWGNHIYKWLDINADSIVANTFVNGDGSNPMKMSLDEVSFIDIPEWCAGSKAAIAPELELAYQTGVFDGSCVSHFHVYIETEVVCETIRPAGAKPTWSIPLAKPECMSYSFSDHPIMNSMRVVESIENLSLDFVEKELAVRR